jgi:nitroimidazol reductase NimA-like FMN-containing flavoprotein (pyridoxamine 5'-phosphate oxidase superfamily)
MKPISTDMIRDLDTREIEEVLQQNYIGSLAFIAHQVPYVLPVTYYFDQEAGCLTSYSTEGHKMEAMRENPSVALGVYQMESPVHWKSVLVHGTYEELHQIDAKASLRRFAEGVRAKLQAEGIEEHAFIRDFSSKADDGTTPMIYRIRILEWSGKCRGQ